MLAMKRYKNTLLKWLYKLSTVYYTYQLLITI